MKNSSTNTGAIVILGYCLLVSLALTGLVVIYHEVIESTQQRTDTTILSQKLIDLNNTLTTMYQAEGTASLLAFADNSELKHDYDSLTIRVFEQIDSLRFQSTDSIINVCLDSLSLLLTKNHDNALEMFSLIKQTDKNLVEQVTKKTIFTRRDIDLLEALIANATQSSEDTVQVVGERQSLARRIGNVFNPRSRETMTQISKSSVTESNEVDVPVLSDTIISYFENISKKSQNKNALTIRKLIDRQREMYIIKELTTFQINKIMSELKEVEYQTNLEILEEQNDSLEKSSRIVAFIGLSALFVAIFFMSWTLNSLNKARRLQLAIQEAKKHAEKLLLSREQLIYTITHDIKAPLSSIIGFLDLMSEDDLSQKQQYCINNINSSTSHIMDLVRNLLDFQSIEKEQPKLTNIAFLPASLILSIYESFLPLSQKKRLKFELNSKLSESKVYLSDPYYIRQIVNNLISNAIKFTPENGQIILITSIDEQNRWNISVQDNGPGISSADQLKIFDEFVRLEKNKNEAEGTGLGLTISQKLANIMGGTVNLESQEGEGSTFTLSVPMTPISEYTFLQYDANSDDSSCRILFVDDDKVQLNLLYELMKREDLSCICCSSAYKALNILQEKSFDLIFTDINIPDMEGFELVRRIRESNISHASTIPIISFSAGHLMSDSELKTAGFNGYLLKPFKIRQLLDIIEKHTTFKRKDDESYNEDDESGWQKITDFVVGDHDALIKIIDSFIEETNKNKELLEVAFKKKDNDTIKQISHKMLSLMRMISAQEIISILNNFEKGNISKDKKANLLRLLEETIKEAEAARKKV